LATKYLMLASTVQFSRYGRESRSWLVASPEFRAYDEGAVPLASRRRHIAKSEEAPAGRSEVMGVKPVPSGPNSVPRQTNSVPVPFQLHECSRTGRRGHRGLPTGQCSTLEHHPRSIRPRHGSGRATRGSLARCSLERR